MFCERKKESQSLLWREADAYSTSVGFSQWILSDYQMIKPTALNSEAGSCREELPPLYS